MQCASLLDLCCCTTFSNQRTLSAPGFFVVLKCGNLLCCCSCAFLLLLLLLCAVLVFGRAKNVGQLPELAAAHPEAYASFADCSIFSHLMKPIDMMLAYDLLQQAHGAVLGGSRRETTQLGNAAAVAALASALTSFVKRTVQFTKATADLMLPTTAAPMTAAALIRAQRGEAGAAAAAATLNSSKVAVAVVEELEPAAAACFTAAVPTLFGVMTTMAGALHVISARRGASKWAAAAEVAGGCLSCGLLVWNGWSGWLKLGWVWWLVMVCLVVLQLRRIHRVLWGADGVTVASSTSSSTQARASSAVLAMIVVRSAVQIAEVLEAAGPMLLYKSKAVKPNFHWAMNPDKEHYSHVLDQYYWWGLAWVAMPSNRQSQGSGSAGSSSC
jgi:hypothetical protein